MTKVCVRLSPTNIQLNLTQAAWAAWPSAMTKTFPQPKNVQLETGPAATDLCDFSITIGLKEERLVDVLIARGRDGL
jgi:hypothetical protein